MRLKNGIRSGIAASLTAVTAMAIATSSAAAVRYPTSDRAQALDNAAGVIFHPRGDCFEIWDNVPDGLTVHVSWNYVGVADGIKYAFSQRAQRTTLRCPNMKEPARIYFRITGYSEQGTVLKSEIVKYRTHGS